jgi:transposase
MAQAFNFSHFVSRFANDEVCLEEIKRLRYPNGVFCITCKAIKKHYKISGRTAYSCVGCRRHVYPLSGTIFTKTSTPLRLWFYAMFLMTHTKADISAKQLQRELGVTYKTAWRMSQAIRTLMRQNNGDLLLGPIEFDEVQPQDHGENRIFKWIFFNKIEFKVVQKKSKAAE